MTDTYGKIETLFDRDKKTFNVLESCHRLPEFLIPNLWLVHEKIHGTNTRVVYQKGELTNPFMFFGGRTDKAQMPTFLYKYLQETFTVEKCIKCYSDIETDGCNTFQVEMFGEGYGSGIQNGGNYRKDVSFRLFDVRVNGLWLDNNNVYDIANKLGIETAPSLGHMNLKEIVEYVKSEPYSIVANEEGGNSKYYMEGIVARTTPLLLRRNGERLMFKLKRSDFHRGKSD